MRRVAPWLALLLSILIFGYFMWKPTPLTFRFHPDLSVKHLDEKNFQRYVSFYNDCFEEVRRVKTSKFLLSRNPLKDASTEALFKRQLKNHFDTSLQKNNQRLRHSKNVRSAWQGDKLVAFLTCTDDNQLTDNGIMLYNICVNPQLRGQKIGSQLMQHAFAVCKQPGRDFALTVYKDHTRSISLYKKLGFKFQEPTQEPKDPFMFFDKYLMIRSSAN